MSNHYVLHEISVIWVWFGFTEVHMHQLRLVMGRGYGDGADGWISSSVYIVFVCCITHISLRHVFVAYPWIHIQLLAMLVRLHPFINIFKRNVSCAMLCYTI